MKSSLASALIACAAVVGLGFVVNSMLKSPDSSIATSWQLAKSEDSMRGLSVEGAFLDSASEKSLYFGILRSRASITVASTKQVPLSINFSVPRTLVSCLQTGCIAYARFDSGPVQEISYATGGWPMASRVYLENPTAFYNKLLMHKKLTLELELADFSRQQFVFNLNPIPDSLHQLILSRVQAEVILGP